MKYRNEYDIMNRKIFFIMLAAYFILMVSESHAGWLIYHKPEYKGRVIDAETKAPIEGAVVAVYYRKENLGGVGYVIHTTEALTDQNGEFVIPSYTTLIAPYSIEDDAEFIIYKPGYGMNSDICPFWGINSEEFFSKEKAGFKGEIRLYERVIPFTYGILELSELKTARQRINAIPSRPERCRSKEFPLLYKLINEENARFGMEEER
jgi:hypothetical protein